MDTPEQKAAPAAAPEAAPQPAAEPAAPSLDDKLRADLADVRSAERGIVREPEPSAPSQPESQPAAESKPEQPAPKPEASADAEQVENWKAARETLKAQKAEIEELKKRLAPPPPVPEAPVRELPPVPEREPLIPSTEPKPKPKATSLEYTPETYFRALVKIEAGELDAVHKPDILNQIRQRMTSDQVLDVQWRALRGEFGQESADVVQWAQNMYPQVAHNERQREGLRETRNKSWQTAEQLLPNCTKRGSAEHAEFVQAYGELAAAVPSLWEAPDAPETIARYVELKRVESRAATIMQENASLKEQLAGLNKQLGIKTAPQTGGLPPSVPGTKTLTPDEKLRDDLRAMGLRA